MVRDNGQTTYFASDIAYHMNKLERGFDQLIDIWGADHHGYVPRVKAALTALGDDASKLNVLLWFSLPFCTVVARKCRWKLINPGPASDLVRKTDIAGPGFINFHLHNQAWHQVVKDVFLQGDKYGLSNVGAGQSVQIEFVSANPTGPLHVGHSRGAAYGATVADLLEAVGYKVHLAMKRTGLWSAIMARPPILLLTSPTI